MEHKVEKGGEQMKEYNYKQIKDLVQPLMKMMSTEYPNNAELIITSNFAEIRYILTDLNFLDKESSIAVSGEELSEFLLSTMKDCVAGTEKDKKVE